MATCKQRCFGLVLVLVSVFLVSYYLMTDHKQLVAKDTQNGKICGGLHDIAKEILNGSRIVLPSDTDHTQWNFHKRVYHGDGLNLLNLIWNSERKMSHKIRDFIKLYNDTKSKDIKVKKHFITFANNCCERSKLKAVMSAIYPGGFDKTKIHDMSYLSAGFKSRHSVIMKQIRGSGYWLWKPYIILKTLVEEMHDGDLLMYQDSGAYLIQDAGPLLKLCEHAKYGILIFYLTLLEQYYTKRDAFVLMEMDNTYVYKTFQRLASFLLFQKNCKSLQFVMEWLVYASDPRLLTDMENTLSKHNLPGFKDHRHDQSILSLLSKKWGLLAYRTPSQYGNFLGYLGGPYGQIIMHDRNRN